MRRKQAMAITLGMAVLLVIATDALSQQRLE